MTITWSTDVNAPCCPGAIVAEDGRRQLIIVDWDCPSVARTFGWSMWRVQRCLQCEGIAGVAGDGRAYCCNTWAPECDHEHTDGTVNCPDCGVEAGDFIAAAGQWLRDNDGATANDPGYFDGETWRYRL
jgi:hypothetical protein